MAKSAPVHIDDTSLPYRVVIDFLEGTLRKQDAIAFARGFIEHHFDSLTNSGYYVAPYAGGYIFEAHEGGSHRAYLPGILSALERDPSASACVQMARRVLEVKKSTTGIYTAILLPEGTEPQNPNKVFPEVGPKLIPFQRSGLTALMVGTSIFGVGLFCLMVSTVVYLIDAAGLLSPPLAKVDYASLPLTQWSTLKSVGGQQSASYVKAVRLQNGKWMAVPGQRQDATPDIPTPGLTGFEAPIPTTPQSTSNNPLAPPMIGMPPMPTPPATPATILPPPPAAGTPH